MTDLREGSAWPDWRTAPADKAIEHDRSTDAPKVPRVYLSGPMSGIPEHNFPAFNAQAERLRRLGYDVVNPVDINPDPGTAWCDCLRNDLAALLTCDGLALLPGWQHSQGAQLELHVAHRVGIEIAMVEDLPPLGKICGNCDTALSCGGCEGLFVNETACLLHVDGVA